jgi:glutamate dehydrogenase
VRLNEDQQKSELIDRLARAARERVESQTADEAERFVRTYYALVSPDDMLRSRFEDLLEGALSLWSFAEQREPGRPKIRAFNPAPDEDGWTSGHSVLEVINDDMPFLVDSVTAELTRQGRNLHLIIHPVLSVGRDASGKRTAQAGGSGSLAESYMHIELDQETDEDELEQIRQRIEMVLADVRRAVKDWQPMRRKLDEVLAELDNATLPVSREEVEESKAFLRWLDDENFVFLGYRKYRLYSKDGEDFIDAEPGTGLGILRKEPLDSSQRPVRPFTAEISSFARRKELLIVAKANTRSTIHRPVHMERIGVRLFDANGMVIGEHRFLGLFTSIAYSRSVRRVPLIREKVRQTVERAGLPPSSHNGKALIQILETLPRDEVFQMTVDELFNTSLGILQLQERQKISVFYRADIFERFMSFLVFVPHERYGSDLRDEIGAILERSVAGNVVAVHAHISDSPLARVHYIVKTTPGELPPIDQRKIEADIVIAARTWSDLLREELVRLKGEDEGLTLHRRYENAFPTSYQERFGAAVAAADISSIEQLIAGGELAIELYRQEPQSRHDLTPGELRCKITLAGEPVALSDIMPRLENMGLRVRSEIPFDITPRETGVRAMIRDFAVEIAGEGFDIEASRDRFEETVRQVWSGAAEDDGFNRLVLLAGLGWEDVVIFRAYSKYLRQIGSTFSEASMQQTLACNPEAARGLIDQFRLRFDPGLRNMPVAEVRSSRDRLEERLERVTNPDEDRILRSYLNLIDASLRTNFFQRQPDGRRKSYLSIKFASADILDLPLPRPMFEIFVYSPRFEGIHLRAGKVARGGTRWSDRREDFRTEILGLMKAQVVKNAVIVPVGAKGGFVLKHAPSDREELQKEGVECYQNFVRGLLDITDNLVDGEIAPPPDVVRQDTDDPYLVVAADKGTATFSDIANGISAEYDFWLGDAFASGGSAGYDHKKMGITARGAWEAVKRHFRELGRDIQSEDFTCVGVGDMAGDVFGNGMLLSEHTQLIAAFNHLHIFVDPSPDAARSFAERRRLFELPRSSWTDYDSAVLSAGGAVFERRAKNLTVSDEVRDRFELERNTVTPNELIQAILRARADLLWLGGIGTYVKAGDESHAEVRDRANDALRVDGSELRVQVVGEGANLGMTQRGRIEFALSGGKINTDAIDNSAGVDTSDHEVNIKISLDEAVKRGEVSPDERLEVLAQMTDEVGQLVLRDNYQQTQAISVSEAQGVAVLDPQGRLMRSLERAGRLDRAIEFLPDEQTLAERAAAKTGLTRPELAVLLAYSKIMVYGDLLESDLPDDPVLVEELFLYFPELLRDRIGKIIPNHRLRREIIATHVTNSMVNRVGPTFVTQLADETGRSTVDIARAYTISRDSFDMRTSWREIEALDNLVPASLQTQMFIDLGLLVERTTRWFLRYGDPGLSISDHDAEFRPRIAALESSLEEILPPGELEGWEARIRDRQMLGIPRSLACRLASLDLLSSFCDIVQIARGSRKDVKEVGRVYFGVGYRLELDRLRAAAGSLPANTPWERAAIGTVVDDLFGYQGILAAKVMIGANGGTSMETVDSWLNSRRELVNRTDQLLNDIRSTPLIDLPMLTVACRQIRSMVETA